MIDTESSDIELYRLLQNPKRVVPEAFSQIPEDEFYTEESYGDRGKAKMLKTAAVKRLGGEVEVNVISNGGDNPNSPVRMSKKENRLVVDVDLGLYRRMQTLVDPHIESQLTAEDVNRLVTAVQNIE